ncbi:MAG: adenylosuccinate lyase family protein [Chloroflexota bacterium]
MNADTSGPPRIAAHPIDSLLLRDNFGTPEIRAVWSDAATLAYWLRAEAALARAQADVGLIPPAAAEAIGHACQPEIIDWPALQRGAELVGYPILTLVRQIAAAAGAEAGRYVHWGATTQDIMDTATSLQLRDTRLLIADGLTRVIDGLVGLTRKHRHTVMAGRTHGQQALPITFGYKLAVFVAELRRHQSRLADAGRRAELVQFAGAAGTLASVGPKGLGAQARMAELLDLGQPEISWHTARDGIAEFACVLGLITGTLAKFAQEVAFLQRTEIGEVEEGFVPGRGGSSTMPQKRNPIASEAIIGAARQVRQLVPALLDGMLHDNERATGPWHGEWLALPEACVLTHGIVAKAVEIVSGLTVKPERMRQNLDLTHGLISSEAVMMALAPTLGRQEAHDVVYDASMAAIQKGTTLRQELLADQRIASRVDAATIDRLIDPANYLGLAVEFVDRVVGQ